MNLNTKQTLIWVSIFSIAMGILEAAVVVYLRELYYPAGFDFPLKMMSTTTAVTELLREAATIIMLVAIGIIAGRNRTERFAYFIYSFAVWDIIYYAFLKAILNWPESLLTWDILFLLPTTWVGPVIAPVLLAINMIILALLVIRKTHLTIAGSGNSPSGFVNFFSKRIRLKKGIKISRLNWVLLIAGSVICIMAFTLEYTQHMLKAFSFAELFIYSEQLLYHGIKFIPEQFPWWIFWTGYGLISLGILNYGFGVLNKAKIDNQVNG